jgi:heme-degrading monooxygenase HmoA
MLVKVFIKRRFKEGKLKEIFTQLRKIRSEAMRREGYVSGETLVEIDDPKKVMVISIWQSMEAWLEWKNDAVRIEKNKELEKMLKAPTEYEAYAYSKYYLKLSTDAERP